MQAELGDDVVIVGVNGTGFESGNADMTSGRTLPWLQEVEEGDPNWTAWGVVYRDVIIVDAENRRRSVYNLTANDLAIPDVYDTLKSMIEAARD